MGYCKIKFVLWCDGLMDRKITDFDDGYEKCREFRRFYDCSYFVMGKEICPDTGKHHIDGYYEYATARKWSTENNKFKKMFGKGYGNLQLARGSAGENFNYTSKEDRDVEEYGTAVANGESLTMSNLRDQVVSGDITVDEIVMLHSDIFHQYGRTLSKIEDLCMRKLFRTKMTKCIWYYGKTATGKSHMAFNNFHPDTHYVWKNDKSWQDGYTQQETVIINDFRGEISYNEFLQLIDKWPFYVSRRGREPMPFTSKLVVVTSSLSPEEIYNRRVEEDSIAQLKRRVKIVEVLGKGKTSFSFARGKKVRLCSRESTTSGQGNIMLDLGVDSFENVL